GCPAILVEQRDVQHQDTVLRLASRDFLRHSRLDAWVGDSVKPGPGGWVAEDQVAEPRPVESSVAAQKLAPERVDDLFEGRLAGHHDLARELLGDQCYGGQVGAAPTDGRLSRAHD